MENEGELLRINSEVDWNLEIGAITRRCNDLKAAAPIFENIKGYPKNFRVLGNILGPTKPVIQGRISLALGLPKNTPTLKLIDEFGMRMKKKPIKPKIVNSGPCKENIIKGKDLDLFRFPAPLIHEKDGGRYIGTWHIDITKDPDTGLVNWGTYRHMIHDRRTLGHSSAPSHHLTLQFKKNIERGVDMPIAIAIGTEPISSIIAGTSISHPPDEPDVVGAMRGEAIELVGCETLDLEVPATAEIVIEGIMKINTTKDEGPFGEFTGYSASGKVPNWTIDVKCITYRDNPILTMTNMGKPWDEYAVLESIVSSALFASELKGKGLSYKSVYIPPPPLAVIISAKPMFAGYAHTLASAIWSSYRGIDIPFVIVVGDDVDVTNIEDVFWCFISRMHPDNGIHIIKGAPTNPLFPFVTDEEKKSNIGSKALFDATFPFSLLKEKIPPIIDFEKAWPKVIREKVISRWAEYGYK